MFQANLLPGHGFIPLTVYKNDGATVTATGRATKSKYYPTEIRFHGILTSASQREVEQWKQQGHPITHKILEYGAMKFADVTDYIVDEYGREFYVQGVKNPGGLNVTLIYFVEERFDFKERKGDGE